MHNSSRRTSAVLVLALLAPLSGSLQAQEANEPQDASSSVAATSPAPTAHIEFHTASGQAWIRSCAQGQTRMVKLGRTGWTNKGLWASILTQGIVGKNLKNVPLRSEVPAGAPILFYSDTYVMNARMQQSCGAGFELIPGEGAEYRATYSHAFFKGCAFEVEKLDTSTGAWVPAVLEHSGRSCKL